MPQSRWVLVGASTSTPTDRADYTRRDGVLVPRRASASFFRDGVLLLVSAAQEGKHAAVIRSLTASHPGSLTTTRLRGIPTGHLADRAIAANVLRAEPPPSRPDADPVLVDRGRPWWWWPTDDVERARRIGRGGRPRKARDHERVARVYLANLDRPTQAVA